HTVKIFKKILDLISQANDFDFWYGFLVEHIYPQLFFQCTYDYQHLIYRNVKEDDEKSNELKDVEASGFGSGPPPPEILATLIDWLWPVVQNEQKWFKIFKTELHVRYFIDIIYRAMNLPLTSSAMIFRILRCVEFWFLVSFSFE
ncbi:hypothetical protein RFI_11866, partial [Reticulomyxa filosa]